MVINLLMEGDYEAVSNLCDGQPTPDQLASIVSSLGAPLVDAPVPAWDRCTFERLDRTGSVVYRVVAPLNTITGPTGTGAEFHVPDPPFSLSFVGLVPIDNDTRREPHGMASWRPSRTSDPRHHVATGDGVPHRWRPALAAIVHRLVERDYAGLVEDGLVSNTTDPTDTSVGEWIERYPATLVDLPDEAWDYSRAEAWPERYPGVWSVAVDLWTEEEGRSDLTMELTVRDDGTTACFEIEMIHVM